MYSFDIFDTLITRDVASPEGIFACMQEELEKEFSSGRNGQGMTFPAYVRDNFCQLRIHAEEIARDTYRKQGYEDILLPQIYEAFTLLGNLEEEQTAWLADLERKTEIRHVSGIRENILYVKELLERGKKVVLISDMYLEEAVIREMLLQTDSVFAGLPLYVSAVWNKTKYSGSLYELVRERELPEGEDWVHIGDNAFSDERQAIAKGIQGRLYAGGGLTPWEQTAVSQYSYHAAVQRGIGLSRLARKHMWEAGQLSDAWQIGCSIGGNILVPYIYWILQVSVKKGYSRLYFIARDGFLLKKIADILIEKYHLDIQTKYIYGSRKAWRIPAMGSSPGDIFRLVLWSHPRTVDTIQKLAAVFGLEEGELYPFLPEGCRHGTSGLGERCIRELALVLDRNEDFRHFLKEKNAPKKQMLQQYLLQELDLSDGHFAFVDLSGGGFSQKCLSEIMRELTDTAVRFFYFRLDQMDVTERCVPYVFVPGNLEGSLIVEMMCRAPHGQTEGYYLEKEEWDRAGVPRRNTRICPSLDAGEQEALAGHGYMDFVSGVLAYAGEYDRIAPDLDGGNDLTLLLYYMKKIVKEPTREVLEFFAGMPNKVTGRENKVIEYAPHLSREELAGIFLLRDKREALEKYYPYSCLEYSLLRCTEEEKAYVAYCRAHYEDEVWIRQREKRVSGKKQYGRAQYFPCELLEKKVVLYGAGKYGCDLYGKIWDWPYGEVVLWVDKSVREKPFQDTVVEVKSPDAIYGADFQQIVVAVADEQTAKDICRELENRGIDRRTVLWWPLYPAVVEWGM